MNILIDGDIGAVRAASCSSPVWARVAPALVVGPGLAPKEYALSLIAHVGAGDAEARVFIQCDRLRKETMWSGAQEVSRAIARAAEHSSVVNHGNDHVDAVLAAFAPELIVAPSDFQNTASLLAKINAGSEGVFASIRADFSLVPAAHLASMTPEEFCVYLVEAPESKRDALLGAKPVIRVVSKPGAAHKFMFEKALPMIAGVADIARWFAGFFVRQGKGAEKSQLQKWSDYVWTSLVGRTEAEILNAPPSSETFDFVIGRADSSPATTAHLAFSPSAVVDAQAFNHRVIVTAATSDGPRIVEVDHVDAVAARATMERIASRKPLRLGVGGGVTRVACYGKSFAQLSRRGTDVEVEIKRFAARAGVPESQVLCYVSTSDVTFEASRPVPGGSPD